MADKARPSKPEGGAHGKPSRAKGSVKGESGRPVAPGGRGKVKPAATSREPVVPPKGRGPTKPEGMEPQPRRTAGKKAKPVAAASKAPTLRRSSGSATSREELPDQVAKRRRRPSGPAPRGYVRFRVRMDDGALTIVDSQLVDSELIMPTTLHAEYAYEVTDGARILHADAIPDLGVVRGFSAPNGTGAQQAHHLTQQGTYEFDARAPATELRSIGPSRIAIVLYRVKERPPARSLTPTATLGAQFDRELREVTRVARIPASALPSELRTTGKSRSR